MADADVETILEIHRRMNLGYPFPKFSRLFLIRRSAVDSDGKVIGGAAIKLVGEAFLWLDPQAAKIPRGEALISLSSDVAERTKQAGLEEVSSWIPPAIEPEFSHALAHLGWKKSPWNSWTYPIGGR